MDICSRRIGKTSINNPPLKMNKSHQCFEMDNSCCFEFDCPTNGKQEFLEDSGFPTINLYHYTLEEGFEPSLDEMSLAERSTLAEGDSAGFVVFSTSTPNVKNKANVICEEENKSRLVAADSVKSDDIDSGIIDLAEANPISSGFSYSSDETNGDSSSNNESNDKQSDNSESLGPIRDLVVPISSSKELGFCSWSESDSDVSDYTPWIKMGPNNIRRTENLLFDASGILRDFKKSKRPRSKRNSKKAILSSPEISPATDEDEDILRASRGKRSLKQIIKMKKRHPQRTDRLCTKAEKKIRDRLRRKEMRQIKQCICKKEMYWRGR